MAKMAIRVILKNGSEFTIKCDKFTIEKNGLGQMIGYDIDGITENKPVYLDYEQIAAIVRVGSNERQNENERSDGAGKLLSFKETKAKCPFCGGENQNARIYEDTENKEFFEYCPVCGIETTDAFGSKAKAVKAFSEGKTNKITGKE